MSLSSVVKISFNNDLLVVKIKLVFTSDGVVVGIVVGVIGVLTT